MPITKGLLRPSALIYWSDLILTSLVAYVSFFVAITASQLSLKLGFSCVSAIAFYRSVYFNHEIVHAAAKLPGFESAYNFLLGYTTKFPSYLYDTHRKHHAPRTYGTPNDPEYAYLRGNKIKLFVIPILISLVLPGILLARFAILPILFPVLGRGFRLFVFDRMSTFALNPDFRRGLPSNSDLRRWYFQDVFCCLYFWMFLLVVYWGYIPLFSFILWCFIASAVFLLNHFRALLAHGYGAIRDSRSYDEQVQDSITIPSTSLIARFVAPMCISYHRTHHLYPGVPYHYLPELHRRLMADPTTKDSYRLSAQMSLAKHWKLLLHEDS